MKRKLKWLAIVLAVLLLGLGAALFLWPRDKITTESYTIIQSGMTMNEVETILGRSGINYEEYRVQRGTLKGNDEHLQTDWKPTKEGLKVWIGQNGSIGIQFHEGRVVGKAFRGIVKPNIIYRFRDWLGW